jgi:hypothetical protein
MPPASAKRDRNAITQRSTRIHSQAQQVDTPWWALAASQLMRTGRQRPPRPNPARDVQASSAKQVGEKRQTDATFNTPTPRMLRYVASTRTARSTTSVCCARRSFRRAAFSCSRGDRCRCIGKTSRNQQAEVRVRVRHTHTQSHSHTVTQSHSHTETQRHRDTETQRHRDTETQRHRDTETQRHRDTPSLRLHQRDQRHRRRRLASVA